MRKPIWSSKEAADIASGMGNIYLVLACLILIPYMILPLLGGKFQPRAFVLYGSWIGIGLIIKYMAKYSRDKIRMKKYKWYLISLWIFVSLLVWFPSYFGLFLIVLLMIGFIGGYKAQGKPGWQDEK